jgi:hypothetical protein
MRPELVSRLAVEVPSAMPVLFLSFLCEAARNPAIRQIANFRERGVGRLYVIVRERTARAGAAGGRGKVAGDLCRAIEHPVIVFASAKLSEFVSPSVNVYVSPLVPLVLPALMPATSLPESV